MTYTDESQFIHVIYYRHVIKVAHPRMVKITAKSAFGANQKVNINRRVRGFAQGVRIKAQKISCDRFYVIDHGILHIEKAANFACFHKRQISHGIHDVPNFIEATTMPFKITAPAHV